MESVRDRVVLSVQLVEGGGMGWDGMGLWVVVDVLGEVWGKGLEGGWWINGFQKDNLYVRTMNGSLGWIKLKDPSRTEHYLSLMDFQVGAP